GRRAVWARENNWRPRYVHLPHWPARAQRIACGGMSETFTAPSSKEEVERHIRENDIAFLLAQFVDMHGKPNAKLVPTRHLDDLIEQGAGFAGFAAGAMGQQPNDPDIAAMPDLRSYTPLPWRPGVARVACDVKVDGDEWPYCPRTLL